LVGFIQGIIFFDNNKKMHLFRCSFIRLFLKNFLMMENHHLKKRIYRIYPFKEVSLQINFLFHQKLIF